MLDTLHHSFQQGLCDRDSNIHPLGGVVPDQSPMPPGALSRCLVKGLTPGDWYAHLNSFVFFWADVERMERHRQARGPQILMTIDAQKLVARYGDRVRVTAFNSGFALRMPTKRCLESFVPFREWEKNGWLSEGLAPRKSSHTPVEFTVLDGVPDIFDFVVSVHRLDPTEHVPTS